MWVQPEESVIWRRLEWEGVVFFLRVMVTGKVLGCHIAWKVLGLSCSESFFVSCQVQILVLQLCDMVIRSPAFNITVCSENEITTSEYTNMAVKSMK